MRLYASNELKSRLTHAAANGSVIAADILSELKKNRPAQEIIRGSYNFLSTKRKWTDCGSFRKIRIVFTAFNKDPEHPNFPDRNNPQAPWFPENRTDLEPSTFIEQFKNLREYTSCEINYFRSAITLDSKVSVRLYTGMNDFLDAYMESNYSSITDGDTSTLHNCKYSINSLVYWVTYVHNVVYSFYRSMIYCYINSTQRCAGSIVIDIIPTNGADKRKFFPFAPYFPVTNVIKRYFYPYFPAIIGIKGYSFPYFPYLSGIMKIKTALYSLFSRLDWHKTVVFPCLGEIYEGIRSLSWEIPVT